MIAMSFRTLTMKVLVFIFIKPPLFVDGNNRNEYQDYINKTISVPNKYYNHGFNTHHYNYSENYLHFFHFYESAIEYIHGIPSRGWNDRTYIAFYDIPTEILEKFIGFGYYPNAFHSNIPFLEYSIPYSKLSNKFINGSIEKYDYRREYSKEYIEYIKSKYNKYLKKISEEDQKLIKLLCK